MVIQSQGAGSATKATSQPAKGTEGMRISCERLVVVRGSRFRDGSNRSIPVVIDVDTGGN